MTNLIHPFTGLHAIGVLPSGKIVWPVMGGDESEEAKAAAAKVAAEAAAKAAKDKADADANSGKTFTQEDVNRIVGERVARAEEKYKDYDVYKTSHEKFVAIEEANKTEHEKALDAARNEAVEKTRKEVLESVGEKLVGAAFTAEFAGRIEAARAKVLIASFDKKSFLTAEGEVDNEKVKSLVDSLAPAGKGAFKPGDFGQGGNAGDTPKGSVAAGADAYAQRHAKKS